MLQMCNNIPYVVDVGFLMKDVSYGRVTILAIYYLGNKYLISLNNLDSVKILGFPEHT